MLKEKLDIIKKKNTKSKFNLIIYKPKDEYRLLVEVPDNGKVFKIPEHKIGNYIYNVPTKTEWISTWDDEYFKIDSTYTLHYKYITRETNKFYLNFDFPSTKRFAFHSRNHYNLLDDDNLKNNENFKIFKKDERIKITALLPIPPLVAICETDKRSEITKIVSIFLKINDVHYRFPYGNVWKEGSLCQGRQPLPKKSSKVFLYNFITSSFNTDLDFYLKYSGKNTETTFNLEHIEKELEKELNERKLSIFDLLYYLSSLSVNEFLNIDPGKIFYKHLKDPKEKY